jgi:hypothetical protein
MRPLGNLGERMEEPGRSPGADDDPRLSSSGRILEHRLSAVGLERSIVSPSFLLDAWKRIGR